MATLYIQEQGVSVRKRDNVIVVAREGATLQTAPIEKIDQVVLMGRGVQISTALLVELIERGVPVTLTNQQGSRHYATLTAGISRNSALRMQQMLLVTDPDRAMAVGRAIIGAKLVNQRVVLASLGGAAAPSAMAQIAAAAGGLSRASTLDELRGMEGAAAAAYFGVWRVMLPPAWGFAGRAYYPPTDPVNALLSFGYTLLLNDMLAAVQMVGLDPYIGTFHAVESGRPSLALDLIEEFRPAIVDTLVLALLREQAIPLARFGRPPERPDAVYLDAEGRALFVARYEAAMGSMARLPDGSQTATRRVLLLQAQQLARVMRGEQPAYVAHGG